MTIKTCNRFGDLTLTKDELLEKVRLVKTTPKDIFNIIKFVATSWDVSEEEAEMQLFTTHFNLYDSILIKDIETNEIYGLLALSDFKINYGSPINLVNPRLDKFLKQFKQINGYCFIIDERLRGIGMDKEMLSYGSWVTDNFDFVWCAIEKDLKSHNYWKRLGFKELFSIPEATFYYKTNDELIEWSLTHFYGIK